MHKRKKGEKERERSVARLHNTAGIRDIRSANVFRNFHNIAMKTRDIRLTRSEISLTLNLRDCETLAAPLSQFVVTFYTYLARIFNLRILVFINPLNYPLLQQIIDRNVNEVDTIPLLVITRMEAVLD